MALCVVHFGYVLDTAWIRFGYVLDTERNVLDMFYMILDTFWIRNISVPEQSWIRTVLGKLQPEV